MLVVFFFVFCSLPLLPIFFNFYFGRRFFKNGHFFFHFFFKRKAYEIEGFRGVLGILFWLVSPCVTTQGPLTRSLVVRWHGNRTVVLSPLPLRISLKRLALPVGCMTFQLRLTMVFHEVRL